MAIRQSSQRKTVTLKDVARLANTTPMTVSNVLNNRSGSVGAELALRVRQVAEDLGYRPHVHARRLRTQRNQVVGIVLVDASPYFLSDPLTAAMLAGFTAALNQLDYSTVLHGIGPDEVEDASFVRGIETDGLCLLLSGSKVTRHRVVERVLGTNQPLVLIQEELPGDLRDAACIYFDDRRGARELAKHLVSVDTAHVVFLVPSLEWPAIRRREVGLREMIAELAPATRFSVVKTQDESFDACQAALQAFLAKGEAPDVVIGGNDQMAIAAMRHLQQTGKRIPEDVRVAGFNGLEFGRYTTPEMTTVAAPAFKLGETAANAMYNRLENGSFPFREMIVPVDLIVRGSSRRQ